MTGLVAVAGFFAVGLVASFASPAVRGRPRALAVLAGAALVGLGLAAPRDAAGWWALSAAAVTLVAMVVFAIRLARRSEGATPAASLDDERW
jgi:hypothetical protein